MRKRRENDNMGKKGMLGKRDREKETKERNRTVK